MKIFLTNKCNLNCVYCFKDKRKKEPNSEEIFTRIKRARKRVLFKGGEPLLRKDIMDILKYSKFRKLNVGLETNGILLNNSVLKYVDEIYFVFDTINFSDWKRITRKTKKEFDKTLNAIKLAKKFNRKIYIDSLLTKLNFSSLEKTKDFCKKNNLILRILKNPSLPGFSYNEKINLPLNRAKFLGKENILYINARKNLLNSDKLKYYKQKRKKNGSRNS